MQQHKHLLLNLINVSTCIVDTHKLLNCFCCYCMCIVGWQVDTLQNDDFKQTSRFPLPSKMIKSKKWYTKWKQIIEKHILKKSEAIQFQAVLCVQPSMHTYVTWVWKTILNDTFHVLRNVSLKIFILRRCKAAHEYSTILH